MVRWCIVGSLVSWVGWVLVGWFSGWIVVLWSWLVGWILVGWGLGGLVWIGVGWDVWLVLGFCWGIVGCLGLV